MRYVTATEGVDIVLGRQGENEVVTVQFDVTGWAEEYGVGEFLLFNERSKDTAAYPCTVTQTGERLDWVIESADVYYSGYGRVQLTYIVNNAVAKSVIYYTVVLPSLDAGDAPVPTPEWIQDVLNYRLESEAYALGTKNGVAVPDTDPTYHNNAKYYSEVAGDSIAELDQRFTGYTFVGTPALTERVPEGTWLKNQIWSGKVISLVGCAYDADIGKLYIYAIFGTYVPPGGTCRTYRMILRDNADPQREFTIDDTSITTEISAGSGGSVENYKYNMTSSSTQDHIDIRLCRVIYDSDGNEIDRIYSAQYRYTIANGKVTQTRFATTPTDGSHIVDIGLRKNSSSVRTTINFTDDQVQSLLPLVSTPQETQWKFIIPDSMFDGATYGLSLVMATGDGKQFVAPSFYKAEDELGKIGNLLISKGLITQEEWDSR